MCFSFNEEYILLLKQTNIIFFTLKLNIKKHNLIDNFNLKNVNVNILENLHGMANMQVEIW